MGKLEAPTLAIIDFPPPLAEDRHSFSPGFIMMAGGPTTFTDPGVSGHSNVVLLGGYREVS